MFCFADKKAQGGQGELFLISLLFSETRRRIENVFRMSFFITLFHYSYMHIQ